jgi:hypothetical protein
LFKIDNAANERKAQQMLALLVAVTLLKNLKPLDTAVYVFDSDSVLCQTAVELFLLVSKLAAFWLLERSYAENVYITDTLKTLVTHKQNVVKQTNTALLVHLEIMYGTLCLADTDYLDPLTVYHY